MDILNKEELCKRCGYCCGECPHLTMDKLCSVYSNRPPECLTVEETATLGVLPRDCGYWIEAKRRLDEKTVIYEEVMSNAMQRT